LRGAIAIYTQQNPILVKTHHEIAEQIAITWQQSSPINLPIIQLCGDEIVSKQAIASVAASHFGLSLSVIPASSIPTNSHDLHLLMRLWQRESILGNSVLLLDCDDISRGDMAMENLIKSFTEKCPTPLVVTTRDRLPGKQRMVVSFDVYKPTPNEQRQIWHQALEPSNVDIKDEVNHKTGFLRT
jgi:hypothetical protein